MLQWVRSLFDGGASVKLAEANARLTDARAALMTSIRARYDNATLTDDNRRNFWGADGLSAKAANSFQVRRQLRLKSRYEVANNPYLYGIVNSNADDLIGTGPTLQVTTDKPEYNRKVERSFATWWAEVDGVEKLRTNKLAKSIDGEGFTVLKTVEDLDHPVKLFPCDIEADQFTSPIPENFGDLATDGLTLHPVTGRPTKYHVLRNHPGDLLFPDMNPLAFDTIQARHVIHWFAKFRPSQVRGIPIFSSALDLFAELRAFRKAVLASAQIAANLTAVLESTATAPGDDEDDDEEYQPFKRVPVERGMMTLLPANMKMSAFDPKHPQTTYEMFQEKCLGEACRPLNYPLNLALGTSQKFNFSSAKLDHINYRSNLVVERDQCVSTVLQRIFRAWFEEAVLCGAVEAYDGLNVPPVEWHWPGFEPLDPVVDATADHERRSHGTLTDREFWARRGFDYRDVYGQLAKERDEREKLKLVFGDPVQRSQTETVEQPEEDLEHAA